MTSELREWIYKIQTDVAALQADTNSREIHFQHDPIGFGGQHSRRLLALRIGMMFRARAVFPSESMFPYELPYTPLGRSLLVSHKSTGERSELLSHQCSSFDFWSFWKNDEFRQEVYSFVPKNFPIDKYSAGLIYDGILNSASTLTDQYAARVQNEIDRLKLPEKFIGVHYRRGDKTVETPYVPTKVYRARIIAAAKHTGIETVYLASDSPRAKSELALEALGLTVIFDENEERLNNANHKYLMKNPQDSHRETLIAVKNLEILKISSHIVGQSNAHFALIAASSVALKQGTASNVSLIEGDIQLQNTLWRRYYAVKGITRKIAKRLFKHRTIRTLKKRI